MKMKQRLAISLLRRLSPLRNREAMIGDLLENLARGRSSGWLWHQVLLSTSSGLLSHWREACLAMLGTALPYFAWKPILMSSFLGNLWTWGINLQWPLSSLYDFGFRAGESTLLVVADLIIALAIKRSLSAPNLLRGALISFAVLLPGGYLTFVWTHNLPHPFGNLCALAPFFIALFLSICLSQPVNRLTNG